MGSELVKFVKDFIEEIQVTKEGHRAATEKLYSLMRKCRVRNLEIHNIIISGSDMNSGSKLHTREGVGVVGIQN